MQLFSQVLAVFHVLFDAIGLPGNLLVIVVISLQTRFHVMRYIFLASLAASDVLALILVNSFRIGSIAQERWLYGETMCHLNACFGRYFYINTVLHLVAVSYERYCAIVRSPLTHDGAITKPRVAAIALIWIIPIPFSIGPFLGAGKYVYSPEVFFCTQGLIIQGSDSAKWIVIVIFIISYVAPFLVIIFLNWSVFKTTKTQINAVNVQMQNSTLESQQQEMLKRKNEIKAAIDVSIIVAAFLMFFCPTWIVAICRQFVSAFKVPAEIVQVSTGIFFVSSVCNPVIYSIRKREFRRAIKKVFNRAIGQNFNDLDNWHEKIP